jgi:hypothetical protein
VGFGHAEPICDSGSRIADNFGSRAEPDRLLEERVRPERAALFAGALYFAVLSAYAAFLGTWTDEEYTLATTAHGFAFAWHRAIVFELQAPLYFAVLAVWRALDPSVWFARLFSIVCATGFLFTLFPILRRVAPERKPLLPALCIACNPFVLYCALDIRLYAPALLISALGWLAFDAGFVTGRSDAARVSFGLLAAVALYTQYFLGFAFVGYAAFLLVYGRVRALGPYIGVLVLSGIAALPLLGIVGSQIGGSGETAASAESLLRETLVHPWLDFVLPYDRSWDALHLRAPYIALALAFLVAYARPRVWPELGAAVASALAIEALFVAVVLVFRLDLDTRHYVVLFVPALVAGYALVAALGRGPYPQIGTLVAWTYGALTLAVAYAQHHQVAQVGDSKRVAAYLASHARAGAVVAVFPADALPVYARQYRGAARLVPFPKALPSGRYDIARIDVNDENEVLRAFAALPRATHVWLVMLGACGDGATQYGCDHVLAGVRDGTDVLGERRFYDSRVFELRVRR